MFLARVLDQPGGGMASNTGWARMHQTKWCDLDLRFAASTEPTCSAVAGKMEAKVTASGAGLLACF
jgi:hypothetical protein